MADTSEMKGAIQSVIKKMMDRVMDNVLVSDPFLVDEHKAKKPLYAALVPDEIFKGSHFERRFVTPFGKVWERLAIVAAQKGLGYGVMSHTITGTVKAERLRRISEILDRLEHPEKGQKKIKPDWDSELAFILEGGGQDIPVTVICDVYAEDQVQNKRYAFELKAPLPNSDQTKVSKEKLLKLYRYRRIALPDFSEQQRIEEMMMKVIHPSKLQGATNRDHMLMGTLTQLDAALTILDDQVRDAALRVAHEKFGLANDRRIIQLVEQYDMISPFTPQAVSLNTDGGKLISYGLSSFGYDLRVADEFEVFTPVLGENIVVDPKNFDRRLLRRHVGDICMIPANSFALARSVEFLKIPPHVLALCLGKCVTGDTRIVDAETGDYCPISECSTIQSTVGLDGWKMQSAAVNKHVAQGVKPVFTLTTKAGLKIRATANHPFRKLHGWAELRDLRPGDRIAIAREIPVFGKTPLPDWEAALLGLMISEGQCHTPNGSPTFTSEDSALVSLLCMAVADGGLGTITSKGRHGYRLVNRPGRGGIAERNRASQWLASHGLTVGADCKFVPRAIFRAPENAVRLFLQALFSGDGGIYHNSGSYFLEYYSNSRRLVDDVHHLLLRFGIFSVIRQKTTEVQTTAYKIQITDREQILRFADRVGFYPGTIKQKRLDNEIVPLLRQSPERLRSNFDTLPSEAWTIVRSAVSESGLSLRSIRIKPRMSQSLPLKWAGAAAVATGHKDLGDLVNGPVWDVVASIEPDGEAEVYDISVPGLHNFVANGLVVHNSTYARCGINCMFTPFEPAWDGHVTIEIANNTPLPAKVYAGEGIAQALFFEGERPNITYADRKGKYQGQKGITPPRV